MTINIRMQGDSADEELQSLYKWLLGETEIRQFARLELIDRKPDSGEMGAAFDVISLVVAGVSGLTGLPGMVDVLRNWSRTRHHKPQITVQRGELKVTFTDVDSEAAMKALEEICKDNDAA